MYKIFNLTVHTFGEKRHTIVTLADKLIVTDIVVILSGVWLPITKYNGTNASHITHVVYIVKPVKQINGILINTFG